MSNSRSWEPGFRITDGKGFHITFENGYTVSIQFGDGDYGDNYYIGEEFRGAPDECREANREAGRRGSRVAEVAVFYRGGDLIDLGNGSVTEGRQDAGQILAFLTRYGDPNAAPPPPSAEAS